MLEEILKIPQFDDPKTYADLNHQLAEITELINKCEVILTHLLMSGLSGNKGEGSMDSELDQYMTTHIKLMSIKNALAKKKEKFKKDSLVIKSSDLRADDF